MQILYPLPSLSISEPAPGGSVTVLVYHVVSTAKCGEFLDELKILLQTLETYPGAMGSKVFMQEEGEEQVRITVLERFSTAEAHAAWLECDAFQRWKGSAAQAEPTLQSVHRYSGMEALFAAGQTPDAPARWKMAVVLLIAVFPLSLGLSTWFGKALAQMPPWQGALLSSPAMVVLMTYVMVPALSKIFGRWLQPE